MVASRGGRTNTMHLFFFCSFGLAIYSYFGYPAWLRLLAVRKHCPLSAAPITPTVSVVMAVRNERDLLAAKLQNLRRLEYPAHLMEILVVSDGSTDGTNDLLQQQTTPVRALLLPHAMGKSNALNHAVATASGEILFFCDVRQALDPASLRTLVAPFADSSVGAVSGELHLAASGDGLGLYWKLEKAVRRLESQTGSTIGVTGAIYTLRRSLYCPLPIGLVLDDVMVPMNVLRQGYRVVFQPAAAAHDSLFTIPGKEFARKVRTLSGNYQMLRLAPWLLTWANPAWFRFVSHKVLRLLVPLFLLVMLGSSAFSHSAMLRCFFVLQVLFYALAAVGAFWHSSRRSIPVRIPYTFALLNAAALVAMVNAIRGKSGNWK